MTHGPALRLDKFLWFARLAQSRGKAQDLCKAKRLRVDGRVVERASTCVRPGQVVSFPRGEEIVVVRVEAIPARRGPFEEARQHYTALMQAPMGAC